MNDFPVLQRHLGVWEGTYSLLDREGKQLTSIVAAWKFSAMARNISSATFTPGKMGGVKALISLANCAMGGSGSIRLAWKEVR